jgi:hypothetical protein
MPDPAGANDKWQRMIDAVMGDPVRRDRLAAALQTDIADMSTADAFKPQLEESGEPITPHDRRILRRLDGNDPTLMRGFRDFLAVAFRNASGVVRLDVKFDYPALRQPPHVVTFTATTMTGGRIECVLPLPQDVPPPRGVAQSMAQAVVASTAGV